METRLVTVSDLFLPFYGVKMDNRHSIPKLDKSNIHVKGDVHTGKILSLIKTVEMDLFGKEGKNSPWRYQHTETRRGISTRS